MAEEKRSVSAEDRRTLDNLVKRGAEAWKKKYPELFEVPAPYTDEEYAQLLADEKELERLWQEMGLPDDSSYTTTDAVNEDRGEG